MKNAIYQRWLAVGLLVLVLLVFLLAVLIPLIGNGLALYDEKSDLLFRLQRQQKIIARKDLVAKNLEAVKARFQEQGYFSNRDTEALASADLQNIIKTTVTDAGGQLTSTQGLPGKTDNDFTKVSVRVRMTCTIETLRTVLHALTAATPVLIIDQIDIAPTRTGRPNHAKIKNEPSGQLNVSFQVVSFIRGAKS
ncbi:MAG: type II secretion system protein GspM [Methylococcales bacterium]|nr:type II secretion system protein GspM [Methylococcales bacterium]